MDAEKIDVKGTGARGWCGRGQQRLGFTLIELLVVIAIIAVLAALIFPIASVVTRARIRARTQAELTQIETAIEQYKIKQGHYPPDNGGYWTTNQLFFELLGTTL